MTFRVLITTRDGAALVLSPQWDIVTEAFALAGDWLDRGAQTVEIRYFNTTTGVERVIFGPVQRPPAPDVDAPRWMPWALTLGEAITRPDTARKAALQIEDALVKADLPQGLQDHLAGLFPEGRLHLYSAIAKLMKEPLNETR